MKHDIKLARELDIQPKQVRCAIQLLDEGNTIPFIARYRKEMTLSLDELQLRNIEERVKYFRAVDERRDTIIESIRSQGNLSSELFQRLELAEVLSELEDLYQPYRPKRTTRASKAIKAGLEPLAQQIIEQSDRIDIHSVARQFISDAFPTYSDVLAGGRDIVAQIIADDSDIRQAVRQKALEWGVLHCTKIKSADDERGTYHSYYEFQSRIKWLKPYQTLAINRGENEKVLRIKVEIATRDWSGIVARKYPSRQSRAIAPWTEQLSLAIEDCAKRLLLPSIERDIRRYLTETAHEHAINVFAENVRRLLLQPPLSDHIILGIDPGFRSGCKIAVVDKSGVVLETATIYPNPPQSEYNQARQILTEIVTAYRVTLITIGNGTASRETEQLVADIASQSTSLKYLMVSEAGASVYSASELARDELPDLDVTLRGAVSIARRVQDPLAELVKIDPKSIGVGLYQHDVEQNKLEDTLEWVVQSVVNLVGVELNTASVALLKYVSGINERIAKNLIDHRELQGRFDSRNRLHQVKGVGSKTFEQAAGFLRIQDSNNWLDHSAIHPESYSVAEEIVKLASIAEGDSLAKRQRAIALLTQSYTLTNLSNRLGVGLPTVEHILEQLQRPGRDPRADIPPPILKSDVLKVEDLQVGMTLQGTVRNVVDFGVFVDIGVKYDGLLHKSKIPDHFELHVGDIVDVSILSLDSERGRIGLSLELGS